MKIQIYIILLLVLLFNSISSTATASGLVKHHPTCSLLYTTQQWKQQESESAQHLKDIQQTFKTNSSLLLYYYFRYIYNYKEQLQNFTKAVVPQLDSFLHSFKILLIAFTAVYVYWVYKYVLKCFEAESKKIQLMNYKIVKSIALFFLIAAIFIALFLSVKGFNQGQKTQQALSNLICKLYDEPKGIVRGGVGQKYDGYNAYISQVEKYQSKFSINFVSIQELFSKQYVIQQMIQISQQMIAPKQIKKPQFITFQQQMNKTIHILEQMNQIYPKIKKSLKWFNKTLQYSRQLVLMSQVGLQSIEIYANQHISFQSIIKIISYLIKFFYLFVIILSILIIYITLSFLLKRQTNLRLKQNMVQYMLTIPIAICLTTAYLDSYIIPGIFWSNNVLDYMYSSEEHLKNQFTLTGKVRADLVELLTQLIPVKKGDFTQMYHGHLFKNITQFGQIIKPYYQVDSNYFDNLFQKGIQLSKQQKKINLIQIQYLQKNHLMKQVLLSIQNAKQGIKQIISTIDKQTGELALIDPSQIGIHLRSVYQNIRIPFFNRVYNARWICGGIASCLLLALVCSIIIKDIDLFVNPKYSKVFENEQKNLHQYELFSHDNIN